MYMIEISEDKIDSLVEHVSKSIKCLGKVAECLEEIRGEGYEDEDEYDERDRYAAGGSREMYRRGGRSRNTRGGRYGNY